MNEGMIINLPGLPVPPTINHYYLHKGHRRIITKRGRVYKAEVHSMVLGLLNELPDFEVLTGKVKVYLDVYRARAIGDLDNFNKPQWDALQGLVYANDNQIVEMHSRRFDDKANPRADVRVVEVR